MRKYNYLELTEMIEEINSYDGYLDRYRYYNNDEDFLSMCFEGKLDELARAICYGSYNYNDDYIKFNGYGNLETISTGEYESVLEENAEEIVEEYKRYVDNGYIVDYSGLLEDEE